MFVHWCAKIGIPEPSRNDSTETLLNAMLPPTERPRERLLKHGPSALSTTELLALLIGHGTAHRGADEIARDALSRFGSLSDMAGRDSSELRALHGMGPAKAATLCAALELAKRLQAEPFHTRDMITSPQRLARLMAPRLRDRRTESFHVLLLNTANQLGRELTISEGSLNACVIHPREVFRIAIAENAASIILVHNHPSGNAEPSKEDIAITRTLVEAGRILDIRVLDHIIIGGDEFTSLAERHLL